MLRHNHNLYTTIARVTNNITGKNQTELSTPILYASDNIKKIDTNKVIISLYFILTNPQFCNSFSFKNLTFNFLSFENGTSYQNNS